MNDELVHHRKFRTRQQAIQEIIEYIEVFYNRQRKQARPGYLSPAAFTQRYNATLLLLTQILVYCIDRLNPHHLAEARSSEIATVNPDAQPNCRTYEYNQ